MEINKPSLIKIVRRAGIKSISADCYDVIKELIEKKLLEILQSSLIVNSKSKTKILMSKDIYNGIKLAGENVGQI